MSGDHIHPVPTSFWRRHVFSVDHKVIAKQFMWFGMAWLLRTVAWVLLGGWLGAWALFAFVVAPTAFQRYGHHKTPSRGHGCKLHPRRLF